MDKKIKTLMVLGGVVLVICVGVFFFLKDSTKNKFSIESMPEFTGDEGIDKIIFEHGWQDFVEILGLSSLTKDSDYEISCQFGPSYETANLYKLFPEELVSMGQIKNCDVETAKAIDKAVTSSATSPETGCKILIEFPDITELSPPLTDYYLFTLVIKEQEITQEWIDGHRGERCIESFSNFIGEKMATVFVTGIVDLKENRLFF